ncbi:hypothetical protein [Acetonema longum]|nr:hypothetical protein [Acetonema longum]
MKECGFMLSPYQSIDTPALLIDIDVAKENIAKMQRLANQLGVKLRPHIKTHLYDKAYFVSRGRSLKEHPILCRSKTQ